MSDTELPERLARVVADPRSYANWDVLHEDLKIVRRDYPFARAQIDGYHPFWVASKFDDIRAISLNNEVFKSGMGGILSSKEVAFERRAGIGGLFWPTDHVRRQCWVWRACCTPEDIFLLLCAESMPLRIRFNLGR
jgi:hypothetical protein